MPLFVLVLNPSDFLSLRLRQQTDWRSGIAAGTVRQLPESASPERGKNSPTSHRLRLHQTRQNVAGRRAASAISVQSGFEVAGCGK